VNVKAEDLITQIQEVHNAIYGSNVATCKILSPSTKQLLIRRYVRIVLTKDRFMVGEYNKLLA
jgi:hypothetical protein